MSRLSSESLAAAAFNRAIAPRAPLYALLDAARESSGVDQAQQAMLKCESLFAGDMGQMLKDVAPHLIEFPHRSAFRAWWFEQWGKSVGVLLEAPVGLSEVRRHLRTLTVVRDAAKSRYFFRFYDPRVLRTFLPVATADELRQFFGPITAFYCEEEGGSELLAFTLAAGNLSIKRRPVGTPAPQEQGR